VHCSYALALHTNINELAYFDGFVLSAGSGGISYFNHMKSYHMKVGIAYLLANRCNIPIQNFHDRLELFIFKSFSSERAK
jgi:hypothetical protein